MINNDLVDLIHDILCFKEHPQDCKYNVESQRTDASELKEHIHWVGIADHLLYACGAESEADLFHILLEAGEVIGKITSKTAVIILAYINTAFDFHSTHAFADQFKVTNPVSPPLDLSSTSQDIPDTFD